MIPWLAKSDQKAIFPNGLTFNSPEEQEQYVRNWAEKRTGFESNFKVTFYPGRYAAEKGSILPVGDPTAYISDAEVSPPITFNRGSTCHHHTVEQNGLIFHRHVTASGGVANGRFKLLTC